MHFPALYFQVCFAKGPFKVPPKSFATKVICTDLFPFKFVLSGCSVSVQNRGVWFSKYVTLVPFLLCRPPPYDLLGNLWPNGPEWQKPNLSRVLPVTWIFSHNPYPNPNWKTLPVTVKVYIYQDSQLWFSRFCETRIKLCFLNREGWSRFAVTWWRSEATMLAPRGQGETRSAEGCNSFPEE